MSNDQMYDELTGVTCLRNIIPKGGPLFLSLSLSFSLSLSLSLSLFLSHTHTHTQTHRDPFSYTCVYMHVEVCVHDFDKHVTGVNYNAVIEDFLVGLRMRRLHPLLGCKTIPPRKKDFLLMTLKLYPIVRLEFSNSGFGLFWFDSTTY